jgi:hypothetical protein
MFERDEAKLTRRIGQMVGELIGRETTLRAIPPANRTILPAVGGDFGADGVKTTIHVEADLACAALLGAALAMIPAGRVQEVVKAGTLEADLAENTHEVFNVMTRALTMDGSIRARLRKFVVLETKGGKPVKHDLAWELSVAGYGAGKLALTFKA